MPIASNPISSIPIAGSGALTGSTTIAEAVVAADTVSSQGVLVGAISEAASAADTTASVLISTPSITEAMSAVDTVSVVQLRRRWFLSFVRVEPPPAGEGPGNPGVLFGDYVYEVVP